jgi:shikimate dehydrogenase
MTDRYAVIGNPIAHSKSPFIHNTIARQMQQDMRYEALLAPLDGFVPAVRSFLVAGGGGMNVTVPFYVDAYQLCYERSPLAEAAGAPDFDTLKTELTDLRARARKAFERAVPARLDKEGRDGESATPRSIS